MTLEPPPVGQMRSGLSEFFGPHLTPGNLIVMLPFAHVLIVAGYLFFYCLGFGSNISSLVSPLDIFSVSLSDVAPIYISSLIIPYIYSRWLFKPLKTDDSSKKNVDQLNREIRGHRNTLIAIYVGGLFITAIALFITIESWFFGRPIPFALISLVFMFAAFVVVVPSASVRNMPRQVFVLVLVSSMFLASVVGTGAGAGQRDRLGSGPINWIHNGSLI